MTVLPTLRGTDPQFELPQLLIVLFTPWRPGWPGIDNDGEGIEPLVDTLVVWLLLLLLLYGYYLQLLLMPVEGHMTQYYSQLLSTIYY